MSINGRVLTKVVPARHLRRSLERRVQFHGSAIADLTSNRRGDLMGGGAVAEEFTALPDPETFQPLAWDTSIGRFLCRLYRRADSADQPGAPLATAVVDFTLPYAVFDVSLIVRDTNPAASPNELAGQRIGAIDRGEHEHPPRSVVPGVVVAFPGTEDVFGDMIGALRRGHDRRGLSTMTS